MLLVTAEKVINRFRIGWKLYEFHSNDYVIDVIMSSRTASVAARALARVGYRDSF